MKITQRPIEAIHPPQRLLKEEDEDGGEEEEAKKKKKRGKSAKKKKGEEKSAKKWMNYCNILEDSELFRFAEMNNEHACIWLEW